MKIYSTYTRWSTLANSRWIRVPITQNIQVGYKYDNNYKYLLKFMHITSEIAWQVNAVLIPNNTSIQQLPIGRNI